MLQFTLQFLILLRRWWCSLVFLSMDWWRCDVELLPCLIGCKLEPYFKDILSCFRSLFSAWIFKNIYLWKSTRLNLQANLPNVLTPLQSPERPPCTHATSKRKNSPNYHFNLGLISADHLLSRHYDPPHPHPKCFNPAKTIWQRKDNIHTIIYFIKYHRGGFGKIWIRKFIHVIFHIFYHSLLAGIGLRFRGNITRLSPLTYSVLILGNLANFLPPFDDKNLKSHNPLVLE